MIGLFLFGIALALVADSILSSGAEDDMPLPAEGPSDEGAHDTHPAADDEPTFLASLATPAAPVDETDAAPESDDMWPLHAIDRLFEEDPLTGESHHDRFLRSGDALNEDAEPRGADGLVFIAAAEGAPMDDFKPGSWGDDYLSTGAGDDTLLGRGGSDTLLAGAGNDVIDDGDSASAPCDTDIIHAGEGDDHITIRGGLNLLSLGDGRDVVAIHPADPSDADRSELGVVISDFDVQLDRLELHIEGGSPNPEAGSPGYRLTAITTSAGEGTLVEPASGMNVAIADGSANSIPGSFALLLGVHPHELSESNIWVMRSDEVPFTLAGLR